ncbi:hypothetical protein CYY_009011 [Polysphondylium violaceum]|uniref:Uncharacterized protein n=1 Tax=Polysphondylium violaceum TaxID=133409 RepID=A0A8J4V3E0_9MYCE|nr:hypothetical protein CYY_009011 [Polysphondylium violaceum]
MAPTNNSSNNIMGIDFGTHYACVGVYKNERIEICPNQQGNRTTPSVVSFVGDDKLVGDEAKSQMDRNPLNTIYDVKNLLGRKTNDDTFDDEVRKFPFKVISYEDNHEKILFDVTFKSKSYQPTPIEIASNILSQIKVTAETFLGEPIKKAVITVPSYFTDKQRKDLVQASQQAGINIVRMIHEHSAVALSYGYDVDQQQQDSNNNNNKNIMVFDLGGSGLSVSLLNIRNKMIEIVANERDHKIGGEAFDQVLVQHFIQEFNRKYRCEIDNKRSKAKLKAACEKAKRNLSNMAQASLEIDSLYEGIDFFTSITRARFEDMAHHLIKSCITTVDNLLKKANISKDQIDKVLLVGGGSRIPAVQSQLSSYFNARDIMDKSMNQEEVVAYGATIQAHIISQLPHTQQHLQTHPNSLLDKKIAHGMAMDVNLVPQSIGINDHQGNMITIIPANTLIPCQRKFKLKSNGSKSLSLDILEGESKLSKDCQYVQNLKFDFEDEDVVASGENIDVTFEFDKDKVLTVSILGKSFDINYL